MVNFANSAVSRGDEENYDNSNCIYDELKNDHVKLTIAGTDLFSSSTKRTLLSSNQKNFHLSSSSSGDSKTPTKSKIDSVSSKSPFPPRADSSSNLKKKSSRKRRTSRSADNFLLTPGTTCLKPGALLKKQTLNASAMTAQENFQC